MAYCLTAPSHHRQHCRYIVSEVMWHSLEGSIIETVQSISHSDVTKYIWDLTAIYHREQWVRNIMYTAVNHDVIKFYKSRYRYLWLYMCVCLCVCVCMYVRDLQVWRGVVDYKGAGLAYQVLPRLYQKLWPWFFLKILTVESVSIFSPNSIARIIRFVKYDTLTSAWFFIILYDRPICVLFCSSQLEYRHQEAIIIAQTKTPLILWFGRRVAW